MNWALIKKYIRESLPLFVACALAIFTFAWFRVWVVGELDATRFKQIIDLLPDSWKKYTPVDFEWLISYMGRTAFTLDEPFLVMLIAIFAIVRGSDVVSGELSRGTLEMVLSQPVSRSRMYAIQSMVTAVGVVLLALICWLGMWAAVQYTTISETVYPEFIVPFSEGGSIPMTFVEGKVVERPMREEVSSWGFAPGILNYLLLGTFLAGMSAFFSSWDRFRWRTLGITVGIYMVAAMIKILGQTSATFAWVMWLSFFSCYEPESMIHTFMNPDDSLLSLLEYNEDGTVVGLGPLAHNLFFLTGGIVFYLVGWRIFEKRDLPAPM